MEGLAALESWQEKLASDEEYLERVRNAPEVFEGNLTDQVYDLIE